MAATKPQAQTFLSGYIVWGATILCLLATLLYIVIGSRLKTPVTIAEPLHIWCISLWLIASAGAIMNIRGNDNLADQVNPT